MRIYLIVAFFFCSLLAGFDSGHADDRYTPMGALSAGNNTGEIPAWTNNTDEFQCPDMFIKGNYLPNPYAEEKPLFHIDYTNVDQYSDRLRPGQIARLKKNKNFFMKIYQPSFCSVFHGIRTKC